MGAHQSIDIIVPQVLGYAVHLDDLPTEAFEEPTRGSVTWKMLCDGDVNQTRGLTAGVAMMGPGGTLEPHRHTPCEFYFGLAGSGTVKIGDVHHKISAGTAVFLPGDAEHGVVAGDEGLTFLFVFPVDRLNEVDYRFSQLT